jgi:hypothetical protein
MQVVVRDRSAELPDGSPVTRARTDGSAPAIDMIMKSMEASASERAPRYQRDEVNADPATASI